MLRLLLHLTLGRCYSSLDSLPKAPAALDLEQGVRLL